MWLEDSRNITLSDDGNNVKLNDSPSPIPQQNMSCSLWQIPIKRPFHKAYSSRRQIYFKFFLHVIHLAVTHIYGATGCCKKTDVFFILLERFLLSFPQFLSVEAAILHGVPQCTWFFFSILLTNLRNVFCKVHLYARYK